MCGRDGTHARLQAFILFSVTVVGEKILYNKNLAIYKPRLNLGFRGKYRALRRFGRWWFCYYEYRHASFKVQCISLV